ncbi:unnamed protein product [Rotaria magnacalcarata]|uniref:Uncharacterized protein n=2 Tax=Rotaria magnacalcarata TaxID=392030 RepID=A0A816S5N9_9BILA|nr:unnamed protein product [Rotaria magnacalcarata]
MDASNNNDAPVTNENSATSEMSTLKLTIETPKDEKDMLIDASSTVKQLNGFTGFTVRGFSNVGARICARVFGEEKVINNDIEEFTYSAITSLRTSLKLNGLLLFDSCMESNIEPDPREIHINGEIEKLYLQEYDIKTLKPINYDVNIDLMWTMFAVPDQFFVIQDLDRFHNLKVELKPSPSKSLSSPRKRSSITRNTASPKNFSRQILESPSVGELFSTSSDDDSADDEVENQLSSLPLPAGRKT